MFMLIMSMILSVAFLTLFESKVLAYIQSSTGPNMIGLYGILQPLIDGIKLMLKENIIALQYYNINYLFMFKHIMPSMLVFFMSLLLYMFMPFNSNMLLVNNNYSLLYMFAMSTIGMYGVLFGGFYSISKYSLIGSLSAISQLISYEVSIGFMLMNSILMNNSFNLYNIYYNQLYIMNMLVLSSSFMLLFMSLLAETNSTPFDLLESESELVAGFLVEYSSMTFVFYYLAEYNMILFWSILIDYLYSINYIFMLYLFMTASAVLPSLKYNQLLILGWNNLLPMSMLTYLVYYSMYFMFDY